MYDKTIASDFRIYNITITATPTLVYDLLDAASKADYDSIVSVGLQNIPLIEGRVAAKRIVIDGSIESYSDTFNVQSDAIKKSINSFEIVAKNYQYVVPVYGWPKKTWVSGNNVSAIVKIFFS